MSVVREVAWIYSYRSSKNADKGGGHKIHKILRTSFMYGPLIQLRPDLCLTAASTSGARTTPTTLSPPGEKEETEN